MLSEDEKRILQYLQSTNAAKTRQQVGQAVGIPAHVVVPCLVRLRDLHLIDKTGSAWRARSKATPGRPRSEEPSPRTSSSKEQWGSTNSETIESTSPQYNREAASQLDAQTIDDSSRWADFRRLCLYYAACVRIEERAHVSAFANKEGVDFIVLDGPIDWRSLDAGQRLSISGREEWATFFRRNRAKGPYHTFYLGTPVDVLIGTSRLGEEYRLISPVMVVSVIALMRDGRVELQPTNLVEINHLWAERRVPDARRRREFLDEIGLSPTQLRDGDQDELWTVSGVKDAVRALFAARKDWWKEYPDPDKLSKEPDFNSVRESGLHNRAVLMCQPPLKFTKRLVDELHELAYGVSDEDLDKTALVSLFPYQAPAKKTIEQVPKKPNPSLAEFCLLNPYQRKACQHALTSSLVTVTGPPGTGKSVVVAHAMVNSAIRGESTLFASRNHQAIEAVEPRINAMVEPETLVLRPTRPFGANAVQFEWYRAMTTLLARPRREGLDEERQAVCTQLWDIVERRSQTEAKVVSQLELAESLVSAEAKCQQLMQSCPYEWYAQAADNPPLPQQSAVVRLLSIAKRLSTNNSPWYLVPFAWFWRRLHLRQMQSRFNVLLPSLPAGVIDQGAADSEDEDNSPKRMIALCERLLQFMMLANTIDSRSCIERSLSALPSREALLSDLRASQRQLEETTQTLMRLIAENAGAQISDDQREQFAQLRAAMHNRPEEMTSGNTDSEVAKAFRKAMPELMRHFLLWSVSNLSVSRSIPLAPASFELLIVDEASQCDIASVVPLLYRAKRATIVGDPNQLSHVTKLGRDTEMRLREQAGVADYRFERFTFAANSAYNLAASSGKRESVELRNHYRCHPEIAEYCNEAFYGGILNVMTDADALSRKLGISRATRACFWEHVVGDATAVSSGCFSPAQVARIVEELERLATVGFLGTVGVVTPFRAQAQRINDLAHQRLRQEQLTQWRFLVDTVDGFQGDERDLVLFSLVGSKDMPPGSAYFLQSTPNRFNVAVSRARALLRVYGDKTWAQSCGIPFISTLVQWCQEDRESPSVIRRRDLIGPIWEPRFADALRNAGLSFEQQYPACGYSLDFALFGEHGKVNVEVDGETHHRSAGGGRTNDDLYRDLILEGAGWRVVRFWVYQVRENINECIARVRNEFELYCCRGGGNTTTSTIATHGRPEP